MLVENTYRLFSAAGVRVKRASECRTRPSSVVISRADISCVPQRVSIFDVEIEHRPINNIGVVQDATDRVVAVPTPRASVCHLQERGPRLQHPRLGGVLRGLVDSPSHGLVVEHLRAVQAVQPVPVGDVEVGDGGLVVAQVGEFFVVPPPLSFHHIRALSHEKRVASPPSAPSGKAVSHPIRPLRTIITRHPHDCVQLQS